MTYEEAFQNLLKSRKNGKVTEGRGSMVKCGETLLRDGGGACKNPVGLSMCDGPMETIDYI